MENWGLILYGESTVLWDEDWYDATYRRGTASIIAHELAHFVNVSKHHALVEFTCSHLFSGLEIWSPVIGGRTLGSTKVLHPILKTWPCSPSTGPA
jgi:hypothetical protein